MRAECSQKGETSKRANGQTSKAHFSFHCFDVLTFGRLDVCTFGRLQCVMHICDIFERDSVTFSFEFFPPRTDDAWNDFLQRISDFESLAPSFVSVTYGAGGSTRERTHDLVVK